MKKLITVLGCFLLISATVNATPNEKVLLAFKQAFPIVQNVQWYEDANECLAYFNEGGVTSKVTFDKEGNFVKSLRYYDEKNLPLNILFTLKKKYADKKIFGVTEAATAEGVLFYIKLTDDKNWYTVKADSNASLEVVEKYKKQAEN